MDASGMKKEGKVSVPGIEVCIKVCISPWQRQQKQRVRQAGDYLDYLTEHNSRKQEPMQKRPMDIALRLLWFWKEKLKHSCMDKQQTKEDYLKRQKRKKWPHKEKRKEKANVAIVTEKQKSKNKKGYFQTGASCVQTALSEERSQRRKSLMMKGA